MKKKHALLGFILAASLTAIVSGCGNNEESQNNNQNQGGPPSGGGMGSATVDTDSIVTDVGATLDEAVSVSDDSGSVDKKATKLAKAFLETLSDEQQKSIQYDLTAENAATWSNLPVDIVQRNGILLGSLSEESLKAAKKLFYVALGEQGYEQLVKNLKAEEKLGESSSSYDADLYYVSILGDVSDSSAWILQVGGHHYANNFTFNAEQTGATPFFIGIEPQTFETSDGETIEALATRKDAVYSMIDSLSDDQQSEAKITDQFDDVLVGPGNDGNFPTESEGVLVSELSEKQQELVKAAIKAWVTDVNEEDQKELLDAYLSDESLAKTYVAWSGSTDPEDVGSYIRIDGPRVWIEFAVQSGIVIKDKVHFHTIWRDKEADYGGEFNS
ncbi:DUF3500 domain-containing protein [Niallia nealsonii]|uniref:DUF3500 domain-containing protein n=1 Tax=Niallia nealsonii TaxID=115979 RepID=A0A2N0Z1D6_9BACI|nr:DUF3500 domain-containing protein [Niallia nealsonii]PKG23318.1 hypothetical protein CWS01_12785 [Niallia nealsonii]